jgi:hypothetical protein
MVSQATPFSNQPPDLQKCTADEIWQCFKSQQPVQLAGDPVLVVGMELVQKQKGYASSEFFLTVKKPNQKPTDRLKWQGYTGMNIVKYVATP